MIELSSALLTRYVVDKDGSTAYQRVEGNRSKMFGFEFAGSVHVRREAPLCRLAKVECFGRRASSRGCRSTSGTKMHGGEQGWRERRGEYESRQHGDQCMNTHISHKWTSRWTSLCMRTYRHHTGPTQSSRGKCTSCKLSSRSMGSRTAAWDAPLRPRVPLG